MKTELIFNFVTKNVDLLYSEEKKFQQKRTVNDVEFSTIPESRNLKQKNITFVSFIYTFSSAGNKVFYTQFKIQIGKSTFIMLSIKEKCREKTPLRPFLRS